MIAWTIPTTANKQSVYYYRYSSSQSNYYSTLITGGGTTTDTANEATYTTQDGFSESSSFSSIFTGYTVYSFDGTSFSTNISEGRSYGTETFSSQSTAEAPFGVNFSNTSSTVEFQVISTFTLTRSSFDTILTTSSGSVNEPIRFISTSRTFTRITASTVNTMSSFKVLTSFIESTVFAPDSATVYEVTGLSQAIYVVDSRTTSWNGYSTSPLQVTTRTTIEPSYLTTSIVLSPPSTTSSTSVGEVTSSYAKRNSQLGQQISTTSVQRFDILPNSTVSTFKFDFFTSESTHEWTLLNSSEFTYGQTGSAGMVTTTGVTSWLTSVALATRKTQNVTVDDIIWKPYSTSFISTTLVGVHKIETSSTNGVDSGTTTEVVVDMPSYIKVTESRESANSFASAFSSEEYASAIITLIGPPQVGIAVPAGSFSRFVEATSGVVIDGEEGAMFTAPQSFSTLFTALDGDGTMARTVMPTTREFSAFSNGSIVPTATYAASGRSISYSNTAGSISFIIGVSGETQTINSGNNSKASVTEMAAAGVYVDKIDGQATSFDGGNTTYTGTTEPYRIWTTAIGLAPPQGLQTQRGSLIGTISLKLDPPLGFAP